MPVDMRTVRVKKDEPETLTGSATYEFDPEALFDREYAKDDEKNR